MSLICQQYNYKLCHEGPIFSLCPSSFSLSLSLSFSLSPNSRLQIAQFPETPPPENRPPKTSKLTASLISSLCSSVNWFCSSLSFSNRSLSRSRRAFSRCCWVVDAPKVGAIERSGSLPRLVGYDREGKDGWAEDAIRMSLASCNEKNYDCGVEFAEAWLVSRLNRDLGRVDAKGFKPLSIVGVDILELTCEGRIMD